MGSETIRVVLYAEGPGETGGRERQLPPPGQLLTEDVLGPGHILLRRCLLEGDSADTVEVLFEAPLKHRGRTATGSMLHHKRTLRQLLTWLNPCNRPDLAIVLVDQDGESSRKKILESHIADLPSMPVIGIAIQEFESWLIADYCCVGGILEITLDKPTAPEKMKPRRAKELLSEWISRSDSNLEQNEIRRRIAGLCNLTSVARECPAFRTFQTTLSTHLRA